MHKIRLSLTLAVASLALAAGCIEEHGDGDQHDGATHAPLEGGVEAAAVGPLDPFGIARLYPTAAAGREYFYRKDATTLTGLQDGGRMARFNSSVVYHPEDGGYWRVNGTQIRFVMTTPSGEAPWRNVEMTMEVRMISGSLLQPYCRGEEHSTDTSRAWHGSANKGRIWFDSPARCGYMKELYHHSQNHGYADGNQAVRNIQRNGSNVGSLMNAWVRFKFVCHNQNGNAHAKMETWVDLDRNNGWQKVTEYVDDGGWHVANRSGFTAFMDSMRSANPSLMPQVPRIGREIRSDEVITWAGDYVSWRTDNATYDFRNLSCREIDPAGDATPPACAITTPSAGAVLRGTASVSATATDNVAVSRVDLLADGSLVGSDSSAPYAFSLDTLGLAEGGHTLAARAIDTAGNAATSAAVSVTVDNVPDADTTAPAIAITSPLTGALVAPGSLLIRGTASDAGSGVRIVELRVDGGSYSAATPAAPGNWSTWSITVPLSSAATYRLLSRATDSAGNQSWHSINVTVDATAPVCSITAPAAGTVLRGTASVSATASDNVAVSRVDLLADGTPVGSDSSAPYTFSLDTLGLAEGSHSLAARAIDTAGNAATSAAVSVTVDNVPDADTTVPAIAITSPLTGALVAPGSLLIRGTASDAGSGVRIVELRVDGGSYSAATPAAPGNWSTWSITVPLSSAATYRLLSRATDGAGNQAWHSINVTVSSIPPPSQEIPASVGPILYASSLDDMFNRLPSAAPGQWIEIADGTYNNGSARAINRPGVIVKARTVGGVTITGQPISLSAAGAWLYGFTIRTAAPLIAISLSGQGCVFKCNTVNLVNSGASKWIVVTAPDVRIERNDMFGKNTDEQMIQVRDSGATNVKIRYNYIHDNPGPGRTPAECLMVGSSSQSHVRFYTEIAHNRFERIASETELFTIKGCNVAIHDNTFVDNRSSVTFRHGHDNSLLDNTFLRCGFRMYGHGHTVRGNQMIDDPNSSILQALVIGSGTASDDPVNRSHAEYAQVYGCLIENNIIVRTTGAGATPVVLGYGGGSFPAINNVLRQNIVYGSSGTLTDDAGGSTWSGNSLSGNIVHAVGSASRGNMPSQNIDPLLVRQADGRYTFSAASPLQWSQRNVVLTTSMVGPVRP